MKQRMYGVDYREPHIYMITLVIEGRKPLLGKVMGDPTIQRGQSGGPRFEPTPLGWKIAAEVEGIPRYYPQIKIIAKQLMPDHLHILLYVKERLPVHLGQVINGFKVGCNRLYRQEQLRSNRLQSGLAPNQQLQSSLTPDTQPGGMQPQSSLTPNTQPGGMQPQSSLTPDTQPGGMQPQSSLTPDTQQGNNLPQSSLTPNTLPQSSLAPDTQRGNNLPQSGLAPNQQLQSSLTPNTQQGSGQRVGCAAALSQQGTSILWEQGYHDRSLASDGQLQRLIDYMRDNPRRLLMKRQNPELFQLKTISLAGKQLHAIGNLHLLQAPHRLAVRLSRHFTADELHRRCEELLQESVQGAVLVSPFISPGERQLEQLALDASLPVMHLMNTGFPPLYKPTGQFFDACSTGRLLLLSPWEYQPQRTTLTRQMCEQLNSLAIRICDSSPDV